jgi:Subtilase family
MNKWFFQPPDGGVAGQDDGDRTGHDGRDGTGQDGRDGTGPGDGEGAGRDDGDGAGQDDDSSAPGLLSLPPALLERHGARVLDPASAVVLSDDSPRPTVYRARTLLVYDSVLRRDDFVESINQVLKPDGMRLVPPTAGRDPELQVNSGYRHEDRDVFEVLRDLPRPAVLAPLPGGSTPVKIDAWETLQKLRGAAAQKLIHDDVIQQIDLEHVLTGSAITGSPVGGGAGGITGGPGSASDGSGPSTTDSYLFSGGDPRTPVAILLPKPERKSRAAAAEAFGRRPVVAVLDTGIRRHDWLDIKSVPGGYATDRPDGFVQIDPAIQDAIRGEGEQALAHGDKRRQVIKNAFDTPMTANPLVGELDPALGHSTFIAGIVRQVVPDAQVLAIRVMNSDDILNEGDIICALRHLAKRIVQAKKDDLAATVDVVSLSFGYFSETRHDMVLTSGLWTAIKVLLDLGVVVVAAAGNFATRRRFYPAAFALEAVPGEVSVISVGALNPNGTRAVFSNDGPWVTAWAQGADVVSTYPVDVQASRTPELRMPVNREPANKLPPGREALDPNDYRDGWAIWSGTSFSAPYLAALITRSLLAGAVKAGSILKLAVPGTPATADPAVAAANKRERAAAAVERLRQRQAERGE